MPDPWGNTDQLTTAELDPMAARLEQRGAHPRFAAMLDDYLEAMRIDDAANVLDMGCGTGIAARAIAKRPGFTGKIVGIDLSPDFIARAIALAADEGVGDRIRFETGNTGSLALADASFDAIVAHTLLSHVDEPVALLAEARRLLQPGGTIAVFDVDWASLTHDTAAGGVAAILDNKPVGAFFAQPRAMRQLPQWAKKAGLAIVATRSHVVTEIGYGDYWISGAQGLSIQLASTGYVSAAQATAWREALVTASNAGEYFGSCNYYAVLLQPAD